MDTELRQLERKYRENPNNSELSQSLVSRRRRAGYQLQTSEDFMLDQKEIMSRWELLQKELQGTRPNFEKLCKALFDEYPNLDQFTILLWVPEFMDGDPLRPDGSILTEAKDYGNYGLIPFDELFEDPDAFYDDPDTPPTLLRDAPNPKLSTTEADEITSRLAPFYEFCKIQYGLNCRINFYRKSYYEKLGPDDDARSWEQDGYVIETMPYNAGY